MAGGVGRTWLSALLALCREEAPGIRLFEAPLSQVVGGLGNDLYDAAFAMAGEMEAGVVASAGVARSAAGGHTRAAPLLAHKRVPLEEVVGYPLVLCHPQVCQECSRQCERLLRLVETPPVVAEYVTTHPLMLALVAAGYGVGFSTAAHVVACRQADVIVRPLDEDSAELTTHLLHPEGAMSEPLRHFIDRAQRVGHMPLIRNGSHETASRRVGRFHFGQSTRPVLSQVGFHCRGALARCTQALTAVAVGIPAMKLALPAWRVTAKTRGATVLAVCASVLAC